MSRLLLLEVGEVESVLAGYLNAVFLKRDLEIFFFFFNILVLFFLFQILQWGKFIVLGQCKNQQYLCNISWEGDECDSFSAQGSDGLLIKGRGGKTKKGQNYKEKH